MAVFIIDGVTAPLVTYNFKDAVRAIRSSDLPDATARISAAACGFMASALTEAILNDVRMEFAEEEKEFLLPYVGGGMIWVEENTYKRYPKQELMGILLHEDSHILNGDVFIPNQGILDNMEFELRADAYAASKVGGATMAKALRRTMFLITEKRFGKTSRAWEMGRLLLDSPSLTQRLDALK